MCVDAVSDLISCQTEYELHWMKTGSCTGIFSESGKAERVISGLFSFRKSHPVRKRGMERSARGFHQSRNSSSKWDTACWIPGITRPQVTVQIQTNCTDGRQVVHLTYVQTACEAASQLPTPRVMPWPMGESEDTTVMTTLLNFNPIL